THFAYDRVGNLAKAIDAEGRATDFAYDNWNRVVAETRYGGALPPAPDPQQVSPDAYESNETMAAAKHLGWIYNEAYDDLTLHDASDVDWFRFNITDEVPCARFNSGRSRRRIKAV